MSLDTTRAVADIRRITRTTDAREVALGAYERLVELLESLEPDDWQAPTECPGWDVSAMVGHLIGAAASCASLREAMRQQWWGWRHAADHGGNSLDATNALQVSDHAELDPAARLAELRELAPAAVAGRMRFPRPLGRLSVPLDPGGSTAPGMPGRLVLGHLMDVVYTRDVWLHTIDIARATSRPRVLDPAVDGRLLEDVVAEWAERHGRPVVLALSGPGAGRFRQSEGGGLLHLDATDFVRILSGRAAPGTAGGDVEVEADPADTVELLQTRLVF